MSALPAPLRAELRQIITDRLADLEDEDARGAPGQATVTLDQQSVGRLSRMDALQNQAMARATHARRSAERQRLEAALRALESDPDYGFCEDCGEPIAPGRLRLDPAVARCISCARG